MSRQSWRLNLSRTVTQLDTHARKARIAVLGVGNPLNGDDAAGDAVVHKLAEEIPSSGQILWVAGGSAPENVTGVLRRFQPDFLLIVDAGHVGLRPGRIAWLEEEEIDAISAFTHGLPLSILAQYVREQTGCRTAFLAIQVEQTEFGTDLSLPVARAVRRLVNSLPELLLPRT